MDKNIFLKQECFHCQEKIKNKDSAVELIFGRYATKPNSRENIVSYYNTGDCDVSVVFHYNCWKKIAGKKYSAEIMKEFNNAAERNK